MTPQELIDKLRRDAENLKGQANMAMGAMRYAEALIAELEQKETKKPDLKIAKEERP